MAVHVLPADLTAKPDLARVEDRLRHDESITLLVNNAGVAGGGPFAQADLDRAESMIQLNVLALTRLAGAALPGFVARGRGIIVNLASVVALAPERFPGVYSATKAFVLSFTESLHAEVASAGVQVQAVLPGATRTEIWERSGIDLSGFPASMIMGVDELVDAALVGLDRGELITLPSLSNEADWEAFQAARQHLGPNLSLDHAASRYKTA